LQRDFCSDQKADPAAADPAGRACVMGATYQE
jgi:hypothetical protein